LRRILPDVLVLLLLTGAGRAVADEPPPWRDDFVARLEALALVQSLNAELLSHDSATLTLDRWCADHRLASPAKIVAERVLGQDKPPTAQQRQELGVGGAEPVRYRRVRLRCGIHVLSEADNWYVPSRLTPEMNRQLETTDIAFGRAVQALKFRRRTLSAELLWWPLPQGWEMGAALPEPGTSSLTVPAELLQHRAVLTLPDGTPFSEVVETYTRQVLAFPEPPRPPTP
jgi:chorismate-pyruvate lyase